ncbi:MAG: 2-oxoacid:ferredoxin oxidoreductase subunit beta [Candidatus Odinarchaeota archaeon]|nr:2-oxoacid:ferredoxin oxidoreductase subunit beta [Candidatus Odinarchaeota archaeon]
MPKHPLSSYLRLDRFPHIFCPGCGIGIVMNALVRALYELKIKKEEVVIVSGIGCTGRISGYINTDGFHATHGRAIPIATAIKVSNPKLKVIVVSGDGDLFAIGGNHTIHAARRNVEITVICVNNFNYGMTGGQYGPTTPIGSLTTTSPFGSIEPPFNLVSLMHAAGASFIARWTIAHPQMLTRTIERAIKKKGFSFIDVISNCPTYYGRYNRINGAELILKYRKICRVRNGIDPREAHLDLDKEIVCGIFVDEQRPGYCEVLREYQRRIIDEG